MSIEENKELLRRLHEEVFSKGNLALIDELVDPNFVHRVSPDSEVRGPEAFKQALAGNRTAFPDLQVVIEEIIAEGDNVALRWRARGTFQQTGRYADWPGVYFCRMGGGKIVEMWGILNALDLQNQIGPLPASAHTGG